MSVGSDHRDRPKGVLTGCPHRAAGRRAEDGPPSLPIHGEKAASPALLKAETAIGNKEIGD